uniref:Uncharacterized protein n=1 Tax=Oryza sativa subsp. japonica TaxID=39947 RepID=Q6YU27_ORYSJ|nr:hypothetical protein [Oryza sativa Japonica Group]BAD16532.1 hypothetical protein [Oryza sativa Japonica Group]BAD16536.1 hypothetical protein [Oryza sativa Japonica Group]BAD16540.1 hypothetical protein [Oryza sativa Japonica Group]BAD16544.1 hypothetical protein [Oryza sativa Japonica Group]
MRKGNYGSAASPLPSARRRLDANARAAAETRLLCALPPSIDSRRCGTGAPLPSAPMRSADAEESRTSGMRRRCCVCVMGRAESKTRGAEEDGPPPFAASPAPDSGRRHGGSPAATIIARSPAFQRR